MRGGSRKSFCNNASAAACTTAGSWLDRDLTRVEKVAASRAADFRVRDLTAGRMSEQRRWSGCTGCPSVAPRHHLEEHVNDDLSWGRITQIHNLEDTQKLAAALERLAAVGVDEAVAPPISDVIPSMPAPSETADHIKGTAAGFSAPTRSHVVAGSVFPAQKELRP